MSNRRAAMLTAGVAAICLGSWLLHEAYEGAGHSRPWWTKFLPGA
jgi:hypothetical protein